MLSQLLLVIIAYLIGSISSAILICKAFGLPDPRTQGSGNPGATNVLRIGGKLPAAIVFVIDGLKGLLPVYVASLLGTSPIWLGIIALAAFSGHLYPIFFNFQGGKGIATGFGAIVGLSPQLGGLAFLVWLVTVLATRYVSLASMIGSVAAAIIAILLNLDSYLIPLTLMAVLTIWRHRSNVKKLITGTENKLGQKHS